MLISSVKNANFQNGVYHKMSKGRDKLKQGCFTGGSKKKSLYWPFVAVLNFTMLLSSCSPGKNESQVSKNVGWGENVRVLASNGQNVTGRVTSYASYTQRLAEVLSAGNIASIEKSNHELKKSGYDVFIDHFTPLETTGSELNIFNKNDINKDRFVLALTTEEDSDNHLFKAANDNFVRKIQEIYNVPKDNIIQIVTKSKEDVKIGIHSIANKISHLKNKANVELLITYAGHGMANALKHGDEKIEGDMEGILELSEKSSIRISSEEELKQIYSDNHFNKVITEKELKQLFASNLSGVKTLLILNTCNAGAFIADAATGKTENVARLLKQVC